MFKKKEIVPLERVCPDINMGLSENELEERKKRKLVNVAKNKSSKSVLRILFENIFNLLSLFFSKTSFSLSIVCLFEILLSRLPEAFRIHSRIYLAVFSQVVLHQIPELLYVDVDSHIGVGLLLLISEVVAVGPAVGLGAADIDLRVHGLRL